MSDPQTPSGRRRYRRRIRWHLHAAQAPGVLNNQREEFFRDRVSLHTSRGTMDPVSGLAFGSVAEASLKNSSTLDPIVPR
jgi:hypothetical protein